MAEMVLSADYKTAVELDQRIGIHRNQGMKYARIGESFSDKNAQSTVHFEKLGTEKLYLLAKNVSAKRFTSVSDDIFTVRQPCKT